VFGDPDVYLAELEELKRRVVGAEVSAKARPGFSARFFPRGPAAHAAIETTEASLASGLSLCLKSGE